MVEILGEVWLLLRSLFQETNRIRGPLRAYSYSPLQKTPSEMRKRGRTDANQQEIVDALRQAGCSVLVLSGVGHGCPDLLVGRGRVNYLLEVKDGEAPPSKQRLTKDELDFFASWRGQATVVSSVESALTAAVGIRK